MPRKHVTREKRGLFVIIKDSLHVFGKEHKFGNMDDPKPKEVFRGYGFIRFIGRREEDKVEVVKSKPKKRRKK